MKKKNKDGYDEMYNETSNTAAGINTPKDHESFGPIDMVSDAVGEIVDKVQHTFDGHESSDAMDDLNETDEPDRQTDSTELRQRHDRHSY
ncbi:hypothetical protein [Paenibacillus sacheonensis]|uniref:Uncharacterized protein n=1 Tax=Paenibacillus sacheonensis TaxID=742054 RepID=A0A7X5C391_9BACL|nr:hypothetical protein [Paenibacillus sacheonensis]MBM7568452.1 hypothetical protein [Paenibacillus sacheonensis]NBC72150.1 hypothetical protein [Paenibacillus sacheonensis]